MSDPYNETILETAPAGTVVDTSCFACDPLPAYEQLPAMGRKFEIDVGTTHFVKSRRNRYLEWTYADRKAPNSSDNHLQGIQRVGDYLYITAGDWNEVAAHLFIIKAKFDQGLPVGGRLERIFCLDHERSHAGGIQRLGHVIGVPIEGAKKKSVAVFIDVTDPLNPKFIAGSTIERQSEKASALALTHLGDPAGRPPLIVGIAHDTNEIDLYASVDADLAHGFRPQTATVQVTGVIGTYQAIAFLNAREISNAGDYEVALIGMRNTSQKYSNYKPGENYTDLLTITTKVDATGVRDATISEPIQQKRHDFDDACGNFAAAAGIDIEQGGLALYTGHHWRSGKVFKLSVCR